MGISYTDNFSFPLLEAGSDGWDALIATVGFHYECDTVGTREIITK